MSTRKKENRHAAIALNSVLCLLTQKHTHSQKEEIFFSLWSLHLFVEKSAFIIARRIWYVFDCLICREGVGEMFTNSSYTSQSSVALCASLNNFNIIYGLESTHRLGQYDIHSVISCHENEQWVYVELINIWKCRYESHEDSAGHDNQMTVLWVSV